MVAAPKLRLQIRPDTVNRTRRGAAFFHIVDSEAMEFVLQLRRILRTQLGFLQKVMFGSFILQLSSDRRHASLAIVKYLDNGPDVANCIVIIGHGDISSVSSDGRNRIPVVPLPFGPQVSPVQSDQPVPWPSIAPCSSLDGSETRSPDGIVGQSAFRGSGEMADTPS